MPLPVAVCSGLVNHLAPRKGKFHGRLKTIINSLYVKHGELMYHPLFGKVSTINGFYMSLPRAVCFGLANPLL